MAITDGFLRMGFGFALRASGEPVVFERPGAAPRRILAIVNRQPPADLPGVQRTQGTQLTVQVSNTEVDGIAAREVRISGCKVRLAIRLGEDPSPMTLGNCIAEDVASATYTLR